MGEGPEAKGKQGVGGRLGASLRRGLWGGRELPLGRIPGADGLAPDKEQPESEGLSWKNL